MPRVTIDNSTLNTEWRLFAILMLLAAAMLGYFNGLGEPDRFIYDQLTRTTQREASLDIVIVAIDDRSLNELGRWPWPRQFHARLLDILSDAQAKAIGLDIILSEPQMGRGDDGHDDAMLARAMEDSGKTVLPIVIERSTQGLNPTLPLPELAYRAAGLGYNHFEFDEDGILRSAYLRENLQGKWWPQFALAVFEAGRPRTMTGTQAILKNPVFRTNTGASMDTLWVRDSLVHIPFVSASSQFRTVSFADVLNGGIAAAEFQGKLVLVGATATGLATAFPTPLTTEYRALSGVEINANILSGLLTNERIHSASNWHTALFAMFATFAAMTACRYLSPMRALALTMALLLAVLMLAYALFQQDVWIPPAAALIMVLAVYPLWSWRRLEAALAFLSDEFARFNHDAKIVTHLPGDMAKPVHADFLDRRITIMRLAADRARKLQQFVVDNLNSMPDAAMIFSQEGDLLMSNEVAKAYLRSLKSSSPSPLSFDALFAHFPLPRQTDHAHGGWRHTLLNDAEAGPVEIETCDLQGKEFLIKSAPSRMHGEATLCWIVLLIDVSFLRSAQRQRDESLNFLSHDMRAPQSSILTLLQLQKSPKTAVPREEFFAKVEKSVQATLTLADDFVHLARAESPAYQMQDTDFISVLADACDAMWALAKRRNIEISIEDLPDTRIFDYWVRVDRSLLVRALSNLLSNAIKFSPENSFVQCRLELVERSEQVSIRCSIADQGKGIAESEREHLFARFKRVGDHKEDGVGLGLAFVKTVIERHGGTIEFESRLGKGTTFIVSLPCFAECVVANTDVLV